MLTTEGQGGKSKCSEDPARSEAEKRESKGEGCRAAIGGVSGILPFLLTDPVDGFYADA